jgi:leucyl aminopeptidase
MGTPGAAGTICGGKFLEAFIPEGVPWAHIDIAATEFNEKQGAYLASGATGVGVRLLTSLLQEL